MRRVSESSLWRRGLQASLALGLVLTGQWVMAPAAHAATSLAVGAVSDTNPASGACSDSGIVAAPAPLSLREATCLANNIGGEVSISVPAGTYALAFGELPAGLNSGQDLTYTGSGSGSTIVNGQGDSRVFNLDRNVVGGVEVTITGLTITGGADSEFGGAGIIGGSNYATQADSLTLNDVVVSGNNANATDPDAANKPGGGIQFLGGTLTITNSTISGNSSKSSPGAGIAYLSNGVAAPEGLTITDSVISGNTMTNTSAGAAPNGGALWIDGPAPATVTGSRFVGNSVTATSGSAVGAAVWSLGANVTVSESTFTGNAVSGGVGTPTGGAIGVTGGTAAVHYNRFTGNTGADGSALGVSNPAEVAAGDNWWGCNGGPGASGCDSTAGSPSVPAYLVLSAAATPSAVVGPSATSTITGRFTTNSAGAAIAPADLDAFATLPVTFSDPAGPATVGGSAGAKTAPVDAGQAQIGYQSNTATGITSVNVTFDNATVATSVSVTQAALFISSEGASFTVGSAASFTVQATGFPTPTIATESPLPDGITLTDNGDGTATLFGTAAAGSGGSYTLVLTASDGVNPAVSQNFTLDVVQPPAFTGTDSATFVTGDNSAFAVTTSGFPAVTSILLTSGALPAGLTFVNTGSTASISGTPDAGTGGTYSVVLTASNGGGSDAVRTFTVQVNQEPAVTTDPSDQTVNPGASVFFVAAAGGVPTPTVQWQRMAADDATFTNIAGATATTYSFIAAGTDSGDAFRAVFTNTIGSATTNPATLTVGEQPTISSPNTATFTVGTAGAFTVTTDGFPDATLGVDPADTLPTWLSFTDDGNGTGTLAGTPPIGAGGLYTFGLVAENGFDPTDSQAFTLTVTEPPTISSDSTATFSAGVAGSFLVTVSGGVPSGPITIGSTGILPPGLILTDNGDGTASLAGTPTAGGVYPFTITATNGVDPAPTQEFTATVTAVPVITSADSTTFTVGTTGTFTITTTAGTPPTTTLTLTGDLPTGITFTDNSDGTATLTGTPTTGSGGTHPLTITATNTVGSTTQDLTLTVDELPAVVSSDVATFTVGTPGTFAVDTLPGFPTASTLDAVLSGSGNPLPGWLIFTDNTDGTGTLTGTPPVGSGGSLVLTITATNATGPAAQTFTLNIEEAPRITSDDNTTFTVGTTGAFTITTTAGTPPTTTLTLTGDLPTGITFTDNSDGTATLTGTPTTGSGGTHPLTITASNEVTTDAVQNFTLTINEPPTITSTETATFALGVAGTFTITTTAGYPTPLTISSTSTLPTGLTLTDNGDGTASLAGTPTTDGVYPLTLTATNGVDPDATQTLTLTVTAAPLITSDDHTTFTVDTTGTFTITTTAGTPPTTTLTLTGDLPTGITFTDNSDGTATLTGTPTTGSGGTHPLTITASNEVTTDAVQNFTLTINEPPTITSTETATFALGVAGTFTITTTAGYPTPLTISSTSTLPTGLTLTDNGDGTASLAGTPTTDGVYPLTLTATNGVDPDATQTLTLTVTAAPLITSDDHTTFTVDTTGTFTITTTAGTPPTTTLTLTGDLPTGITFTDNSDGTATLTGTPTTGSGGTHPLTITASNEVTTDAVQNFTLTINEPPTITSTGTVAFIAGVPSTFVVTAAAGFPVETTLTLSGALPTGVTFTVGPPIGSGATASLSGTSTAVGSYPLSITASNGVNPDAVQDFVLVVAAAVAVPLPADPPELGGQLGGVPPTVQGGQMLLVTGDGCAVGAPVTVGTYPTSATLATTTANSEGGFSALVTVPTPTGDLEIVASCISVEGVNRFIGTTTTITAPADTPIPVRGTVPTPYVPSAAQPDRSLSYTGSPTGQIATTALALLLMGGLMLVLAARRRRGVDEE